MSKRRTDDEVNRLLKDADRDLAKGLTVSDFCRKVGVAQTTYYYSASSYPLDPPVTAKLCSSPGFMETATWTSRRSDRSSRSSGSSSSGSSSWCSTSLRSRSRSA